jgi:hypothetical protein
MSSFSDIPFSVLEQIQERLLEWQRGQSEDVAFEIGGEKQIKF